MHHPTSAVVNEVVVIGAGIVGVCCALSLQQSGAQVTLVDRLPPGDKGAASYGNAGSISWSSCIPIAMPGLMTKVPGWLLRPDGPLAIRWQHLPTLLPWLWRFVRAGNEAQVAASAAALAMLHAPALELHQQFAQLADVPDLISDCDYLHIYSASQANRLDQLEWRLRAEHGARLELLDQNELGERVPALARRYPQTVNIKEQGFVRNPSRLVAAYAAHFVRCGGRVVIDEVRDFETENGRVVSVRTSDSSLPAGHFVIAAGPWSRHLTKKLGFDIPLDTERGYHITVENPGISVNQTLMETDAKFVVTPMETGLRFAGTVELANIDAAPDYRRTDAIRRAAERMFPGLNTQHTTPWMGRRPSLPDGLPIIDRLPTFENVLLAFGHAHTGMVGAPQTGRLVSELARKQPSNFDLTPFGASRFS